MTAPERIWATHSETWGAVELGQWADTVRHKGGEPYVHERLYTAQQETIAALVEALEPFSNAAGEMFARNWETSRAPVVALDSPAKTVRVTAADFFAARAALARAKEQDMTTANRVPLATRAQAYIAETKALHRQAEQALQDRIDALEKALRGCLNYMENTEAELGITLDSAASARAALGKGE